jgi:hypothetical protein
MTAAKRYSYPKETATNHDSMQHVARRVYRWLWKEFRAKTTKYGCMAVFTAILVSIGCQGGGNGWQQQKIVQLSKRTATTWNRDSMQPVARLVYRWLLNESRVETSTCGYVMLFTTILSMAK